jgi:Hypothetical glycosyl hydrolase family 15
MAIRGIEGRFSRWSIIGPLALFCLSCALMLPAPVHASVQGQVNLVRNATSEFDGYTSRATSSQRLWIDAHYSSMRGYAPYFNQALPWAPPADFYRDLYAIYPSETSLITEHPSWILKDTAGNDLYIPYSCNGTSCSQFAGDVGNPEFRRFWIERARGELADGYRGIFIDDVNLEMKVSNGSGKLVAPLDPRTGRPMTETDWQRYIAEFTEEIRAAMPSAEIVHNTNWWEDQNNAYVQREINSADAIELERGFSDTGLTGGTGRFAYKTLLAHIDWLHSLGKAVMLEPYLENPTQREFELSSYFLINNSTDSLVSAYQTDPGNYWPGWETDLGAALGPRYEWHGLLRRDFRGGIVLVNPPEAATTAAALGRSYTKLDGTVVSSVQLSARQGVVLTSPSLVSSEGEGPAAEESTPPSEGATPEAPSESGTPGGPVVEVPPIEVPGIELPTVKVELTAGLPAPTSSPTSASPTTTSVAATEGNGSVAAGQVTIAGQVSGGGAATVTITLERQLGSNWGDRRQIRVPARRNGHFAKRLVGLGSGRYRAAARAAGHRVVVDKRSFAVA